MDDTFNLAEILINDKNEMIQNVVGGFLREAGMQNTQRLLDFLNRHAKTMTKNTITIAVDGLSDELRKKYLRNG